MPLFTVFVRLSLQAGTETDPTAFKFTVMAAQQVETKEAVRQALTYSKVAVVAADHEVCPFVFAYT